MLPELGRGQTRSLGSQSVATVGKTAGFDWGLACVFDSHTRTRQARLHILGFGEILGTCSVSIFRK